MSAILSRLRNKNLFSASENEVARFMRSHPHDIIHMSVREIAARTFTSPTTIMRVCKKVCDGGFAEFRIELAKEVQLLKDNVHLDEGQEALTKRMNDLNEIMTELMTCITRSIADTRLLISAEIMEDVVQLITHSSVIDIYGRGSSNNVGLDFRYKLFRLGFKVQIFEGLDLQAIQAYNSDETHCAIILSSTGETPEIINFAKILNNRGTPIISITGTQDCTLLKHSDYPLFFKCFETNKRVGGITSRNAMQYVLDTIYFSIVNSNYEMYSSRILSNYVPIEIASKNFTDDNSKPVHANVK